MRTKIFVGAYARDIPTVNMWMCESDGLDLEVLNQDTHNLIVGVNLGYVYGNEIDLNSPAAQLVLGMAEDTMRVTLGTEPQLFCITEDVDVAVYDNHMYFLDLANSAMEQVYQNG